MGGCPDGLHKRETMRSQRLGPSGHRLKHRCRAGELDMGWELAMVEGSL